MFIKPKKRTRKLSIVFFFGVLWVILVSSIQVSALDYQDISVEDAKIRIDTIPGIFILDVRSHSEYFDGHIQGAVNINVYLIYLNTEKLPTEKDTEIIVYCDNGFRSERAAEDLVEDYNYSNVYDMLKGFNEWKKKGYPFIVGSETIPTTADISWFAITLISLTSFILIIFNQRVFIKITKK